MLELGTDGEQVKELLVSLVPLQLFLVLTILTYELGLVFLEFCDPILELFNLFLDLSDFIFGLLGLVMKIHFEFVVLLSVLVERLDTLIELLLLHDDVFLEELGLFSLVVDGNLGHEDLSCVVDKILDSFFLLAALVQIFDCFGPLDTQLTGVY